MRNGRLQRFKTQLSEGRLLWGDTYDKSKIRGAEMVSTNALQCNVRFQNRHIWSNCRFRTGDIIEVCPGRKITGDALYSREVRNIAIRVSDDEYVIPLGYCQFYDIVDKNNPEANCKEEWNPRTKCVIIRAITDIPKNTILVLEK